MKLQYLLAEYITEKDGTVKERFSIAIGNENQLNTFPVDRIEWAEYLKQLTKDNYIGGSTKAHLNEFVINQKFHLKD